MPRPDARFAVDFQRDVRIPTGTRGVTLSADVYRPVTTRRVPVLVTVLPYRKDFVAGESYDEPARWFAARGYAGLVVDLLGTGASDGVRRPEFDPGDAEDGLAAADWAAAQPWCDGAIGMWGLSYAANTTLRTASRYPDRLRAIVAVAHGLDPARDSVHPDGARGDLHALVNRGASMLVQQLLPPLADDAAPANRKRWKRRLAAGEPVFMDSARHGPHDPVWRERAIDGAAITAPALCVGGWRDAFPDGLIDAYERIRGPKKLLMGPWGHLLPHRSAHEPADFLTIALRWWEHWLGGVPTGVMDEPAVTLYRPGPRPRWLGYDRWPPPSTALVLGTGADVRLGAGTAAGSTVIARHEPDATVGALRGLPGLGLGEQFPPQDQHDDDMRSVAATSEPLPAGIVIGGRAEVRVSTADAVPLGRLVARLTEVDPDGRSTLITAGVHCAPSTAPSTVDEHVVTLRPIVHPVPAGHRLRVAIGDADFPRLMPLVGPAAFDVTAIEVSVPTLPETGGVPVTLPAVPPPEPAADPGTGLRITRDQRGDEIEVVLAGGVTDHRSPDGHRYRLRGELRARVRRAEPETAVATGTQVGEVRMSTGEVVTASATVLCTQTALRAQAEVTADGAVIFARCWQAPLEPDTAAPAELDTTAPAAPPEPDTTAPAAPLEPDTAAPAAPPG
ncbi:MAG TPA: CocE/NonD family hydrolase [Mycobacteriales bacterium]|nr:CocE/NonD family hydrolase [Mycobacteriales bacterium]